MTGVPVVVLDACVLVNFALCDALLRLAEPPALFEPRWSDQIMAETTRTLREKLDWPAVLVAHFERELRTHFAEAWVTGHEPLMARMTNDEKDRHVVAAAVHGGAPAILTFNLRHFRTEDLAPWEVTAWHPGEFLCSLYRENRLTVLNRLQQQASDRGRSMTDLIHLLAATVPEFSALVLADS